MAKKRLATGYTFDASAQTIVHADFSDITLAGIQLIVNVTDQIIIYNFADTTKGGTLATDTLTLEYNTTAMSDTDELMILVEDGVASQAINDGGNTITVDGTVAVTNAGLTALNGAIAGTEVQVDVLTLPAIPAGTNNIGDVDVLTINGIAPAFGTGARGATVQRVTIATDDSVPVTNAGITTIAGAVAGTEMQVDVLTMPSVTVTATDLDIRNLVFATDKVDASGTTLGANSGVDIGDVTINNASGASAVNIQDGGNTITVDGAVTVSGTATVSATDLDIRNLVAATDIVDLGGNALTSLQLIDNIVSGTGVNVSQLGGAAVPIGAGTEATAIRVTLPTNGTGIVGLAAGTNGIGKLTANAGVTIGAVEIAAAQTLGTVTTVGTVTTLTGSSIAHDGVDSGNPHKIGGKASSTVPTAVTAADRVDAWFDLNGRQVVSMSAPTGTQTSVAGSASNVTLLAANVLRKGATIYNDSTAILYVRLQATATTSNFSVKLFPDDLYEVPFGYYGIIDGLWASATGNARVTEFT